MADVSIRPTSTKSTVTSVASVLTTSTLILAANPARRGASIANTSTSILYLLLGSGSANASTSHTVKMAADTYYEVPFGYTGVISGSWVAANGQANVTEFT